MTSPTGPVTSIGFSPEFQAHVHRYMAARDLVRRGGYFYVMQLAPDIAPGRIKLGWALVPLKRLRTHRCSAPTARLVKMWPCEGRLTEGEAIREVTRTGCVPLSREVFDVDDLAALVGRLDSFFATSSGV